MFKGSRWRSDKNRIVAVFKFQFHATQVSEFGGDGMVVSVVPADNGKPTAKLEKCVIRENCCYWENPVCETVKFIHDPKSGKIHEKIYYFIVSSGSPKGSLVGEFSVNIADYLEATKACSVSFPFKKSISNSHFHVLIQRIQESDDQRYLGDINIDKKSFRKHFSEGDAQEGFGTNNIGDEPLRKTISHMRGLSGTHRGSNGSNITLSSSKSSSGLNTPKGPGPGKKHNNCNKEEAPNGSTHQDQKRTQWDLAIVPVNNASSDSDKSQIGLDESVEKLKSNLVALSRRAEVSEIELQTLRKQIVKESKKGQDLLKEVANLKEENNALKDECKKLKASQQFTDELGKLRFKEDYRTLIEKIEAELNHEKDINANLRVQLRNLEETSKENNKSQRPNRLSCNGSVVPSDEESVLNCLSDDEEQRALEELVKEHSDAQESYLHEQKVIVDLSSELEMCKRDKDDLEMQMEQLALDYEISKQENHELLTKLELIHKAQMTGGYASSSSCVNMVELEAQRDKLQLELNEKSRELAECLATVRKLEACKEELEKQLNGCKAEKEEVRAALSQSMATVNKLEAEIQKLKTELEKQFEELSRCLTTIHGLETQRHDLEDELSKQSQEFKADIEALTREKTGYEKVVACSETTIDELNRKIAELKNEVKIHAEASAVAMAKFIEFEAHIQKLEEEMDKQVEGFEADLEAVSKEKVEQEKRAIRAEEKLRLMKWKNVNMVAKIQDEYKRLHLEMQLSLKLNEEIAIKALAESDEVRFQNCYLRDMLQKANQELHSVRHDYDSKIQDLNDQINMKSIKLEQIVVEFGEKCNDFESQINHIDELRFQNHHLRDKLQKANEELHTVKQDYESKIQELNDQINLKSVKLEEMVVEFDEKCNDFESRMNHIDELQLQNHHLRDMLQKANEELHAVKHEYDSNIQELNDQINLKSVKLEQMVMEFDEKCIDFESQINHIDELQQSVYLQHLELRSELDRVETENELLAQNGKQEERDLYVVDENMEGDTLEDTDTPTKVDVKEDRELIILDMCLEADVLRVECENLKQCLYEEDLDKERLRKQVLQLKADLKKKEDVIASIPENLNNVDSVAQMLGYSQDTNEVKNFDILLKEMVSLKEKNNSMEVELKEIQERYSDMSVKFAEVEGERQKLVMALRNVKYAKKS